MGKRTKTRKIPANFNPKKCGVAVLVPFSYYPDKPVDFVAEIQSSLNQPLILDKVKIDSPSIGVFSLLEIADSQFFKNPLSCELMDACIAVHIAIEKDKCFQDVLEYSKGNKDNLEVKAGKYLDLVNDNYEALVNWLLVTPFTGYEMINESGAKGSKLYVFGAETIAQTQYYLGRYSNSSDYEIMWNTPLSKVGHLIACYAKQNGCKNIYRPKDDVVSKETERINVYNEKYGYLHIWQIEHPDAYKPSQTQIKARPEIVDEHKKYLNQFHKKKQQYFDAKNGIIR